MTLGGRSSSFGRGLEHGKAISDTKMRSINVYYDNRFAQDALLLFSLANTKLRQ